jgi:hypothetical protein
MAAPLNITQLQALINSEITTNGVGSITGAELNAILLDMIAALAAPNQVPVTTSGTTAGLATDGDVLVNAPGAVTYDLASAALATRPVCVKDTSNAASTNNITIAPSGTQTINGVNGSIVIRTNGGSFTLRPLASGLGWYTV